MPSRFALEGFTMPKDLLLLLVAGCLATAVTTTMAVDDKTGHKIGDRLNQPAPTASTSYKDTKWEALVPKNWDPSKKLRALNFGLLKDSDPRAIEALKQMREIWDNAPVEMSLRGERIRIAGFMIPLERKGEQVTEFLLVPYFGACIHVPPPPANQIIHVVTVQPLINPQNMDSVWVSGVMDTFLADSPWGVSGYKMKADLIEPYTEKR
jgi:hypothetical protein